MSECELSIRWSGESCRWFAVGTAGERALGEVSTATSSLAPDHSLSHCLLCRESKYNRTEETLGERIRLTERELATKGEELDQLTSEHHDLVQTYELLVEKDKAARRAAEEAARLEKANVDQIMERQQRRIEELETSVAESLRDQGGMKQRCDVMQAELDARAMNGTPGTCSVAAQNWRVAELEGQLKSKQARIDQLGNELEELEARLRHTCESKMEVARQADAANAQGLGEQLAEKTKELQEVSAKLETAQAAEQAYSQELLGMLQLWQDASEKMSAMKRSLTHMEEGHQLEVSKLGTRLSRSMESVARLQRDSEAANRELVSLTASHEAATQELTDLKQQFDVLHRAYSKSEQMSETLLQTSHDQLIAAHKEAYKNEQNAEMLEGKLMEVKQELESLKSLES